MKKRTCRGSKRWLMQIARRRVRFWRSMGRIILERGDFPFRPPKYIKDRGDFWEI